jgi:hypothetical protein
MKPVHIHVSKPLPRRTVLKGLGVAIALPFLECMAPAIEPKTSAATKAAGGSPRRLLAINTNQGILPQYFFPTKAGKDYDGTPYLDLLKDHRERMTVFSGVSLPQVDGGHHAEECFLTGAPHPNRAGFHNTISLDQFAAERVGLATRLPSLTLGVDTRASLSYTAAGVRIPADDKPSQVFKNLFVQGNAAEVEAQIAELRQQRSVLDAVGDRAKQLNAKLNATDRAKVDQYFTSLRELERRLVVAEEWERKPKPTVDAKTPADISDPGALIPRTRAMLDLARLALVTDSTRLITVLISQFDKKPDIPGVNEGTHPLTHHGNQPEKIAQLKLIEEAQFRDLNSFLTSMAATKEPGGSLLDSTMVYYGTHMGSANAHSNDNLPVLVVGGGFKHAGHLAFNRDKAKNYPLSNLYVSMLQRLGVDAGAFASSTGTMQGLDLA